MPPQCSAGTAAFGDSFGDGPGRARRGWNGFVPGGRFWEAGGGAEGGEVDDGADSSGGIDGWLERSSGLSVRVGVSHPVFDGPLVLVGPSDRPVVGGPEDGAFAAGGRVESVGPRR